jgi:hypothetical protein
MLTVYIAKQGDLANQLVFWLNIWRGYVLANVVKKIPIFIFLLYIDTAKDVVIFRATLPVFQRQDLHLTVSWNHKFNMLDLIELAAILRGIILRTVFNDASAPDSMM